MGKTWCGLVVGGWWIGLDGEGIVDGWLWQGLVMDWQEFLWSWLLSDGLVSIRLGSLAVVGLVLSFGSLGSVLLWLGNGASLVWFSFSSFLGAFGWIVLRLVFGCIPSLGIWLSSDLLLRLGLVFLRVLSPVFPCSFLDALTFLVGVSLGRPWIPWVLEGWCWLVWNEIGVLYCLWSSRA